jgi:hypothetical protein
MTIPWQPMTAEELARFRCASGERIIRSHGVFWRQVRPFFYRPLLPFQEYQPELAGAPAVAFLGGFQHAVPSGVRTNSFLNLLICDNLKSYSLGGLQREERRQIRRAAEAFTVSPVTDVKEFKANAYAVYRSFYERTQYEFKSERRYENNFSRWAQALFQNPKVIILGAYDQNRQLVAIGVWYLVADTLIYSTFFCETKSLKMHVAGLMLHTMREAAAGHPDLTQIFVGNYKFSAAAGVDKFYFERGFKLIRKPAWLQLNPLVKSGLKHFAPAQYGRLIGEIKAEPGGPEIASGKIIPPAASV